MTVRYHTTGMDDGALSERMKAGSPPGRARPTEDDLQRQWQRFHLERRPRLADTARVAWQTAQRDTVLHAQPAQNCLERVEVRLQRIPTSLRARRADPIRLRRNIPPATASSAAPSRKLRARSRRSPGRKGQVQPSELNYYWIEVGQRHVRRASHRTFPGRASPPTTPSSRRLTAVSEASA